MIKIWFVEVMEPFTASNIKARPKNVVKDFVHVAGLLKVNYFIVFFKWKSANFVHENSGHREVNLVSYYLVSYQRFQLSTLRIAILNR